MNRGDRVLAWWPNEKDWWYAGVICSISGSDIEVQYDDSNRAVLTSAQVRPLVVGVGSRVYVRWKGGETYYPGRIGAVEGAAMFVEYDDGDKEWCTVCAMRIHAEDL
jgi:hypothetical protein